jgi:hypothetical protein
MSTDLYDFPDSSNDDVVESWTRLEEWQGQRAMESGAHSDLPLRCPRCPPYERTPIMQTGAGYYCERCNRTIGDWEIDY